MAVIAIIEMDAEFIRNQIGLPSTFWHPEFSELAERLRKRKNEYCSAGISRAEADDAIFLRYSALLDLTFEELCGKRVLDAGCGPEGRFAVYCLAHGIADADGCDTYLDSVMLESYPGKLHRIDYRELPETIRYDYILCVGSYNPRDGTVPIGKFLRCLNPEGEIRIYPIHLSTYWNNREEGKDDWMRILGSLGRKFEYEFRPTQVDAWCPDVCEVLIIRHSRSPARG